jgi:hypothetical protein
MLVNTRAGPQNAMVVDARAVGHAGPGISRSIALVGRALGHNPGWTWY